MKQIKRLLTLLSFLLISSQVFAQEGTLNYSIVVNDSKGPKANLPIVLIETSTFSRKEFKTDAGGRLVLALSEGNEWMMNVGGMKNDTLLHFPRGTVVGIEERANRKVIQVEVPLAKTIGYISDLRTLTSGRATINMKLSHYEIVPNHVSSSIMN